jgi:UDP-N-acetylmuramate dehydrogenase
MIDLTPYNTFHIAAKCTHFFEISNNEQMEECFSKGVFEEPFFIIGSGSNVLFTQDFLGNVVHLSTKGITMLAENSSYVYLKVAAGEDWEDLIQYCIDQNYYGIENLTGIPGKVGSSPVQNIGAYGVEVKDTIFQVHAYSLETHKLKIFTNQECQFGYRDSIFKNELKNKYLITHVVFELSKIKSFNFEYTALKNEVEKRFSDPSLAQVRTLINEIRNSKLPDITKIGSAGSFFKNPIVSKDQWVQLKAEFPQLTGYDIENQFVKLAAGQLIDLAGWKGYREGDAGVYPLQALVLVNYGNATGKQILELCQKIQKSVFEIFQVTISPEVNIL